MSIGTSYILAALAAMVVVGFIYFEYKHGKLTSLLGGVQNGVSRVESVLHIATVTVAAPAPAPVVAKPVVSPSADGTLSPPPKPIVLVSAPVVTAPVFGPPPQPPAVPAAPPTPPATPPTGGGATLQDGKTPVVLAPQPTDNAGVAAAAQRDANLAAYTRGLEATVYKGPVPIASLTVDDKFYLGKEDAPYMDATRGPLHPSGRDIFADALSCTFAEHQALAQWLFATTEPGYAQFNVAGYTGPLKAVVANLLTQYAVVKAA